MLTVIGGIGVWLKLCDDDDGWAVWLWLVSSKHNPKGHELVVCLRAES